MKLTLIGSGNVATQLALALHPILGIDIIQVISRHIGRATELAEQINATASTSLRNIDAETEVIIMAIKDDAISEVADRMPSLDNKILLHTAGSVPGHLLASVSKNWGVLYPLQTLSKSRKANWREIPILISGANNHTLEVIEKLARQISIRVHQVDDRQRFALHLAAVFSCNFTNAMWDIAAQICAEHDVKFDWLSPLIAETIEKLKYLTPHESQTGPALRNDQKIMQQHLRELKDSGHAEIYRLLSEYIQNRHRSNEN